MATKAKEKQTAVVVTTQSRGVFFGYANNSRLPSNGIVELKRARNCIYWRGIKGFLDLAVTGPTNGCRIGPAANIELSGVTCLAVCTDDAVTAWEKAPW